MRCDRTVLYSCLILCSIVVGSGCGGHDYGPTGEIEGRLTMDGKPLAPGHAVTFMDMERGYVAFGLTDKDGRFVVDTWNDGAMPVGEYKVMIAPPEGTSAAEEKEYTSDELFDNPELMDAPAGEAVYPRKYANTKTSGLVYTIKEGSNVFEIDLKSKVDKT